MRRRRCTRAGLMICAFCYIFFSCCCCRWLLLPRCDALLVVLSKPTSVAARSTAAAAAVYGRPNSAMVVAVSRRTPLLVKATSDKNNKNEESDSHRSSSTRQRQYVDDCFGLIFLSCSALGDPIFASTFLVLSFLALLATRLGKLEFLRSSLSSEQERRQVPAVVAAATLALSPLTDLLFGGYLFVSTEMNENAKMVELVVCSISMLYALLYKETSSSS
jgi:hypothetical protein